MRLPTTLAARLNGFGALGVTAALLGAVTPISADAEELSRIGHIIVIYQENWSFDSLYGLFP